MREENAPCYGCPKRCAGCHSYCEEYGSWNAAHIQARDERYAANLAERVVNDFIMAQGKRTRADNIRKHDEKKRRGIR